MNPNQSVRDRSLYDQRDFEHDSGLAVDYFEPAHDARWFHFLLGFCVGMGAGVLLAISMFGTRL